jgi:uncharacterized protein
VSARLRQWLWPYLRDLGGEPAVALLGACVLLTLSRHHGSTGFFRQTFGEAVKDHPAAATLPYFWWFGSSVVFYLVAPLALAALTGGGFTRRYGLGLGDWRAGLSGVGLLLGVMIPATFLASHLGAFAAQYPLAGQAAFKLKGAAGADLVDLRLFALYEASYFAYFVAWEFLFRGWLLNALLPRFGRGGAVLIQTVPFVLMHFGKPELEVLGSIPAGVALGVLALRTRSFWYGALLHGVVAVWMDVLVSFRHLAGPG